VKRAPGGCNVCLSSKKRVASPFAAAATIEQHRYHRPVAKATALLGDRSPFGNDGAALLPTGSSLMGDRSFPHSDTIDADLDPVSQSKRSP
jgi:hypothetical protein